MNKIIQYGHLSKNSSGEDYYNHIFSSSFATEFCSGFDKEPLYELTFEYDENQTRDKDEKNLNIGDGMIMKEKTYL